MKGIVILSFHKKPGAFVDREYPKGLSKKLGFGDTEQNKVYSLHRMRNMKPNFLFLKEKGINVASFFSGFDSKHFIGRPNQCVSIFLDKENPTIWEDILRRITLELLPKLDNARGGEIPESGLSTDLKFEEFDILLRDFFYKLEKNEIEPLLPGEGETGKADDSKIGKMSDINLAERENATINSNKMQQSKGTSMQKGDVQKPDIDFAIAAATKQMEEMEKTTLRRELQEAIESNAKKDQELRDLKDKIAQLQLNSDISNISVKADDEQVHEIVKEKDIELDKWRNKVVELNEVNFINQDQILKLTEMSMMQTQEQQSMMNKIHGLKKELDETKAKFETINAGIDKASDEEKTMLIESLKVEVEALTEKNKEIFMKNKNLDSKAGNLNQVIDEKNQKIESLEIKLSAVLKKLTKLTTLEEDLENAYQKIEYLSGEIERLNTSGVSNDGMSEESLDSTMLQIKCMELDDKIENMKIEMNQLKKNNKLQRREIDMLRYPSTS